MAKGKVPPDTFRLRGPSYLAPVKNPEVGGSCYDAVDFAVGDQYGARVEASEDDVIGGGTPLTLRLARQRSE